MLGMVWRSVIYRATQNCNLYKIYSLATDWQGLFFKFQAVTSEQKCHGFFFNSTKLPCVSISDLKRSKPSTKVSKLLFITTRYLSELKNNEKINLRSSQKERNLPFDKPNQLDFKPSFLTHLRWKHIFCNRIYFQEESMPRRWRFR